MESVSNFYDGSDGIDHVEPEKPLNVQVNLEPLRRLLRGEVEVPPVLNEAFFGDPWRLYGNGYDLRDYCDELRAGADARAHEAKRSRLAANNR